MKLEPLDKDSIEAVENKRRRAEGRPPKDTDIVLWKRTNGRGRKSIEKGDGEQGTLSVGVASKKFQNTSRTQIDPKMFEPRSRTSLALFRFL